MIGDAWVVALGEATHETREVFEIKHRVLRYLAEEEGFTAFGMEASMAKSRLINHYVQTGEGNPKKLLVGFHSWPWNTQEVLEMIKWMRRYSVRGGDLAFYGFDPNQPMEAAASVREFVKESDPSYLSELDRAYDIVRNARAAGDSSDYRRWHESAQSVLHHLKANRDDYLAKRDSMEVAWAIQEARLVMQHAKIYLQCSSTQNRFMADNAAWILDHLSREDRLVLWATTDT